MFANRQKIEELAIVKMLPIYREWYEKCNLVMSAEWFRMECIKTTGLATNILLDPDIYLKEMLDFVGSPNVPTVTKNGNSIYITAYYKDQDGNRQVKYQIELEDALLDKT